jgi:hypothetical protein
MQRILQVSGALPTLTAESVETHRETEAFVHEQWQATLTAAASDAASSYEDEHVDDGWWWACA